MFEIIGEIIEWVETATEPLAERVDIAWKTLDDWGIVEYPDP